MLRFCKATQYGLVVAISVTLIAATCLLAWRARATPKPTVRIRASEAALYCVAFSPNRTEVAVAGAGGGIELIDVPSGRRMRRIESGGDLIYCLAFSHQGSYLASGHHGGAVRLWEYPTGRLAMQWMAQASVTDIAFLSEEGRLAIRTIEGITAVYDLCGADRSTKVAEDTYRKNLTRSRFTGRLLVPSSDGRYCAEGFEDGRIELRDMQDSRVARMWKAHRDQVNCITFSPDSQLVVSGGGFTDHPVSIAGGHPQVCVWTVPGAELIARLVWHREAVTSVAVSCDGQWLASVDLAGWLCLWNLRNLNASRKPE